MKIVSFIIIYVLFTNVVFSQIKVNTVHNSYNLEFEGLCTSEITKDSCNPSLVVRQGYENYSYAPDGSIIYLQNWTGPGRAFKFGKSVDGVLCGIIEDINYAALPYPTGSIISYSFGSVPDFFDNYGRHYHFAQVTVKNYISVFVLDNYATNKLYRELPIQLPLGFAVSEVLKIRNKLYIMDGRQPRNIYVYDENYTLVDIITPSYPIEKMTVRVIDCDSIEVYGFGLYPLPYAEDSTYFDPTYELDLEAKTDSLIIFKIDLEAKHFDSLCVRILDEKTNSLLSVTSPTEHLASETECDLLIDLDRDNSGRYYPYDFAPDEHLCFGDTAPVTDRDVYVHATFPIDTIYITLRDIRDGNSEYLTMSSVPAGLTFIQSTPTSYMLYGNGSTEDSTYSQALKNLVYHNTSSPKTYGVRTIEIQGVNAYKRSLLVNSYVTIGITITTDSLLCENENVMVNGKTYHPGDTISEWRLADEGCDTLLQMPLIAVDTSLITFTGDTFICDKSYPELSYSGSAPEYYWTYDGETRFQKSIQIKKTGKIKLRIVNDEGCSSIKAIDIRNSPEVTVNLPDTVWVAYDEWEYFPIVSDGDVITSITTSEEGIKLEGPDALAIKAKAPFIAWLNLVGQQGCTTSDTITVMLTEGKEITGIPNIISLSSSGNNAWEPVLSPHLQIENCQVYDRWGNVVYHWSGEGMVSWNGRSISTKVTPGVYVYTISTVSLAGGKRKNYIGEILVVE